MILCCVWPVTCREHRQPGSGALLQQAGKALDTKNPAVRLHSEAVIYVIGRARFENGNSR
jgi:hypothetical protein